MFEWVSACVHIVKLIMSFYIVHGKYQTARLECQANALLTKRTSTEPTVDLFTTIILIRFQLLCGFRVHSLICQQMGAIWNYFIITESKYVRVCFSPIFSHLLTNNSGKHKESRYFCIYFNRNAFDFYGADAFSFRVLHTGTFISVSHLWSMHRGSECHAN